MGVGHVGGDEAAGEEADGLERLFLFGEEVLPVFGVGFGEVDGDEAGVGGVFIGDDKPGGVFAPDDVVAGVEGGEEFDDGGVWAGFEVAIEEGVFGTGAFPDVEDEVALVFGEAGAEAPFGVVGTFVDEGVFFLGIAEAVEVEFLVEVCVFEFLAWGGGGVAGVEEAGAVGEPGGAGEFDPFEFVGEAAAGFDFDDMPGGPVGAGLGEGVGEVFAVVTFGGAGDGDGAIGGEGVGVEEEGFLGAGFVVAPEEDALVLEAGFAGVEEATGDE